MGMDLVIDDTCSLMNAWHIRLNFLKDAEPKAAPVVKNAFALMAQRHKTLELRNQAGK